MSPKDGAAEAEQRSPLRLPNKISDANAEITSRLRCKIKKEIEPRGSTDGLPCFFYEMASFTCLLPPHWESYPADLKMFLEKEMFDPVLLHVLRSEGLINWCHSVQKVHPLITPGDGNCLLHAVSLALWGIEDDDLTLRTALFRFLRDDQNPRNHMRWQRERLRVDAGIPGSGLVYNSTEWRREWDMVKEIASPEQRPVAAHGLPYESLEQFHIFMLANMLRRPIIVVAQDMMRSQWGHSLQPQNLHGIYLPLNWDPNGCCRYPVLLGFHQNHFTPLLCTAQLDAEEDETFEYLFPIVQCDYTRMPVHFLEEDEETRVDSLLQNYLIIEEILLMGDSFSSTHGIRGARLVNKSKHPDLDLMIPYLRLAETHYRAYLETEYGNVESFAAAYGGKTDTKSGGILEKPSSSGEQPITGRQANSWSVLGGPISQPLDAKGKTGKTAGQNLAYQRTSSLVNKACKTPGCEYYQSVSTGEYCHQCYSKQTKIEKCQGEGCLNPAEQSCQGFCRVCFDEKKLMGDVLPVHATAPPLSKMSLDPTTKLAFANTSPMEASAKISTSRPGEIEPKPRASSDSENRTLRQNPSPDDELTTLIIEQKLATKKCIIPECPLTGDPTKNGMCLKCYEENIKAEQEIASSRIVCQPGQTRDELAAQSTSKATSGGATGDLIVAGATGVSVTIAQKPSTKYTVQKSICANAGCEGVRLVDQNYRGYCIDCYKRNYRKTDQRPPSPDPSNEGKNAGVTLNQKLTKWREPFPQSNPVKYRPQQRENLSNMELVYSNAPQPNLGKIHHNRTETQNIGKRVAALLNDPIKTNENKIPPCVHPCCDKLAAPPMYKLCVDCIAIYEAVNEETPNVGSSAQIITSSAKAKPLMPKQRQLQEAPKQPAVRSVSPTLQKTADRFKSARINRVKCQVPGGCPDDMYGDPELSNFCSRCFNMMSMRRTRTQPKQPVCHAETRPTQPVPYYQMHTAPMKPSPRNPPSPRTSKTEVIYGNPELPGHYTRPTNYQKCASDDCTNQANMQILDGYCNDCHRVYRQHGYIAEMQAAPQVPPRGRFAQSSQSTVPEAWGGRQMGLRSNSEEKILNITMGTAAPPKPDPNRTDMGCRSEGCTNFGNPRCQGYCNSCFRLMK